MIDIQGKELKVGQSVAYNDGHYVGVRVGKVDSFTEKRVRVAQGSIIFLKKPSDICIINGGN